MMEKEVRLKMVKCIKRFITDNHILFEYEMLHKHTSRVNTYVSNNIMRSMLSMDEEKVQGFITNVFILPIVTAMIKEDNMEEKYLKLATKLKAMWLCYYHS